MRKEGGGRGVNVGEMSENRGRGKLLLWLTPLGGDRGWEMRWWGAMGDVCPRAPSTLAPPLHWLKKSLFIITDLK